MRRLPLPRERAQQLFNEIKSWKAVSDILREETGETWKPQQLRNATSWARIRASMPRLQAPRPLWPQSKIETLRKLWDEGLSASQIAAELGGLTRNAVIGQVHRLGLQGRVSISKKPPRPKVSAQGRRHRSDYIGGRLNVIKPPPKPLPPTEPQKEFILGAGKLLEDFDDLPSNPKYCRWPVNERKGWDEHIFCAAPVLTGCPYCKMHARLALTKDGYRRITGKAA